MTSLRRIAIITGASSGLGREYARQLSSTDDIDELWLIARRRQRLEQIDSELSKPCRILPLDLTRQDSFTCIADMLKQDSVTIRWLINAAGIGYIGTVRELGPAAAQRIIALNCTAPVTLTELCLPYLSQGSCILQIASCAAFLPLPCLTAYAASKAFLLNYSRALAEEIKKEDITVTAVCPYWIRDTEFISKAKETDRQHHIRRFSWTTTCQAVVTRSLQASCRKETVCTPDFISFSLRILSALLPNILLMRLSQFWNQLPD